MSQQTSFNVESARDLQNRLQQFLEVLHQELGKVQSQWQNIKSTWHDQQFDRFEPIFEKFLAAYDDAEKDCERYIAFLNEQIQIAEKRRHQLGQLQQLPGKIPTAAGMASASQSNVRATPPKTKIETRKNSDAAVNISVDYQEDLAKKILKKGRYSLSQLHNWWQKVDAVLQLGGIVVHFISGAAGVSVVPDSPNPDSNSDASSSVAASVPQQKQPIDWKGYRKEKEMEKRNKEFESGNVASNQPKNRSDRS